MPDVDGLVEAFLKSVYPSEASELTHVFVDARINARSWECHVVAEKLVTLSTTDVPLDPEDQPEYRANREIVTSHYAFEKMKQDAKNRRSFSNIVAEFTTEYDADHALKSSAGNIATKRSRRRLLPGSMNTMGLWSTSDWTPTSVWTYS